MDPRRTLSNVPPSSPLGPVIVLGGDDDGPSIVRRSLGAAGVVCLFAERDGRSAAAAEGLAGMRGMLHCETSMLWY